MVTACAPPQKLNIKNRILHINHKSKPVKKEGQDNKSTNEERIIIVTSMLLLKARCHQTSFLALKRMITAGLNLVNPLANDETETWRKSDKSTYRC